MLFDKYNRKVNYLRVSVTERCNFRCQYCMPDKPFSWVPRENLLSFEELFLFIKVAIDEGIDKIRITGGEPTLRENLDIFIKMINDYKSDIDLALTTNGYLLEDSALKLKNAGLKRVNISLDTLVRETAKKIASKDVLPQVLKGIEKSLEVGLKVKINNVPLKGINDHEILDILEYCKNRDMSVRYIEYMENSFASKGLQGLNSDEIKNAISKRYKFKEVEREPSSPAQSFQIEDGYLFGIIDPHKHDFCESCNRIRLTAEGNLIPCLYFDEALSIAKAVKNGNIDEATQILATVLRNKPKENRWNSNNFEAEDISTRAFYETGG